MAGEKLELPIGIPVDTNADAAASAVESLREQIEGSTADIKAMAGTLRQLRGSSDEVKAAKTQLTAKIEALKNSVSGASLALVKQGTSYDAAAQRAKKLAAEAKKLAEALKKDELVKSKDRAAAMGSAISKAGGPVAALRDKMDALKSVLGEAGGSAGMGLVTLGAAAAVAAVAALTAAVVAGGYALTKFILLSGNAARDAGLLREAWSGTAQNASNLGTQIDALSNKVPTSKAALNELAISLMKSKLGGQATVDAFNAVGQASAALGDEAGGKIKDFIERSRLMGRMRIDPREMLEGFGNLNFDDVAKALAKNTGRTVEAVRNELRMGKTKLGDGAKAMRDAIESKFGGLNLRKMMSLEVMASKLQEKLAALTNGVNLEPLLKPLSELGKLFDESTVTGQTLKMLVTSFGQGMVSNLTKAIPFATALFQGLVIGSLKAYIVFLKVRKSLRETFGDSKMLADVDGLKLALDAGKYAAIGIAGAVVLVGAVMAAGLVPIAAITASVIYLADFFPRLGKSIRKTFDSIDWKASGLAIVDGLIGGLKAGVGRLNTAVEDLGKGIKKTFTNVVHIGSPSKDFFKYGEALPEGVVGGVEKGTPGAQKAVSAMVAVPSGGDAGAGARAGGGAPIEVHVHIHAGGGGGEQTAKALSEESFLAKLTKAVEDALVGAGIPVQS